MQITDLQRSTDPLAALLAMSDDELDCVAAEAIGAEIRNFPEEIGESLIPHYSFRVVNADGIKGKVRREALPCRYWMPSRKIGQAHELLDRFRNDWWSEYDTDFNSRFWALEPRDLIVVWENKAGSHARAVTILAVCALLTGKDGGE